jgi:RNA 2',3'-cyclic 3'-phosphodiesterase
VGQLRRLFLGVPLGEDVRAMLAQHLQQHRVPGRPVPPANWHLTIRFLGNVGQIVMERLIADLDQADLGERFEVVLGEMGAFPRAARASVVWLALAKGGERLSELNEIVEAASQAVGLTPEERPFAPHLTLSRIRPELDVRADLAAYRQVPFQWTAYEIVLYESHAGRGGAVYEPVEKFRFGS